MIRRTLLEYFISPAESLGNRTRSISPRSMAARLIDQIKSRNIEEGKKLPPDRGPTPLGAEGAEDYGNPSGSTQRYFVSKPPSMPPISGNIAGCARSPRNGTMGGKSQIPEMRDSPPCCRRREIITLAALTQDIGSSPGSIRAHTSAPADWQPGSLPTPPVP